MAVDIGKLLGGIELEDKVSDAVEKANSRLLTIQQSFDKLGSIVDNTQGAFNKYSSATVSLSQETDRQKEKLKALEEQLEGLTAQYVGASQAQKQQLAPAIKTVTDQYLEQKRVVDTLKASQKDLDTQVAASTISWSQVGKQLGEAGRGMKNLGVTMTAEVTAPIVGAGLAVVEFGGDFERAMNKAQILGGLTRKEMEDLRQPVLDIAKSFGQMPADVAMGLDVIGSAMMKGKDATDALEISTKMASLGMGSVEETTRAVVGAMLTYKDENLNAAKAGDTLLKTVQLGNMRIGDLVTALSRVNPLAAALGVKFSDVNATMATFTHLGASADVAATGVRALLSNILNDSAKTEKGLKSIGVSIQDLKRDIQVDMVGALLNLVEAAKNSGEGIEALNKIFPNIRGLTVVLADAVAQGKMFREIGDDIKNSAGALNDATADAQKTWVYQMNQLKVAFTELAIQLSQTLLPILKDFVKLAQEDIIPALESMVKWFNNLPEPVKKFAVGMAGLAALVGPALIVFGQMAIGLEGLISLFTSPALAAAFGYIGTAFTAIGTAISTFLLSPLALVVGAFVALNAAFALVYGWDAVIDFWKDLGTIIWEFSKKIGAGFLEQLAKDWENFKNKVRGWAQWANDIIKKLTGKDLMADLEEEATKVGPKMESSFSKAITNIRNYIGALAGDLQGINRQIDQAEKTAAQMRKDRDADLNRTQNAINQRAMDEFFGGKKDTSGQVKFEDPFGEKTHAKVQGLVTDYNDLSASVQKAANALFEQGATTAQTFNELKKNKLVTDDMRIAIDNLHRAYKEAHKWEEEVAEARHAAYMATVPLTQAQETLTKELLGYGLAHTTVAKAVGADVAQINAWVKAQQKAAADEKEMAKAREDAEKQKAQGLARVNKDIETILRAEVKAREDAEDRKQKATLSTYEYEKWKVGEWLKNQKAAYSGYVGDTSRLNKMLEDQAAEMYNEIEVKHREMIAELKREENSWANGLAKVFDDIPGLIKKAFTGGGGIEGAFQAGLSTLGAFGGSKLISEPLMSLFNKATPFLTDTLGKTLTIGIGNAIPFIGPAIGALLPTVIGGFKKLFGAVSEEEKKGRAAVTKFEDQLAGMLTAAQKAEAGGVSWKKTTIAIRDAYLAVGMTAEQAAAQTEALWRASKQGPEAVQKEIDKINEVIDAQKKLTEARKAGLDQMVTGTNALSDAFRRPFDELQKKLDDTKDELEKKALVTAIQEMATDSQAAFESLGTYVAATFAAQIHEGASAFDAFKMLEDSFQTLRDGVDKFHLSSTATIDSLLSIQGVIKTNEDVFNSVDALTKIYDGLTQSGYITQELFNNFSNDIARNFKELTDRGVDANQAMVLMQPSLQKLWEGQQKYGFEVDETTKALLEQAEKAGIVGEFQKDVNEKILDVLIAIADVFGAKLPASLEVAKKAAQNTTRDIQQSLDQLKAPDLTMHVQADTSGLDAAVQNYATGGTVYAATGRNYSPWGALGSDTVPAMLTPGERVLSIAENRYLEQSLASISDNYNEVAAGLGSLNEQVQNQPTLDDLAQSQARQETPPVQIQVVNNISAIDSQSFHDLLDREGIPYIIDEIADNRRSYQSRFLRSLGVKKSA